MGRVTLEQLRAHLAYDESTGVFTRLIRTAQRSKVGDVAGSLDAHGYWTIRLLGATYKAHRLAWFYVHGQWPEHDMDHINGQRSDNRICNLRPATRTENCRNAARRADNQSGHKGVYWCKAAGKWAAECRADGEQHYLGLHDTVAAASAAYSQFAEQQHGAFFPHGRDI